MFITSSKCIGLSNRQLIERECASTSLSRPCLSSECTRIPSPAVRPRLHYNMASPQDSVAKVATDSQEPVTSAPEGFQQVLFVEAGTGADQHGQNATKAAVRACRNAIEFNSLPAIRQLVPGGYNGLKLRVKIGVPDPEAVDVAEVRKVFPYGQAEFEVVDGGLRASSGIAIADLGDKNDEWYIAVAAVTVGY